MAFSLIASALAETAATGAAPAAGSPEAAQATGVVGLIGTFLPMVLLFVVFYFFMIRPQRKKDKQVRDMLSNLKVTDRVRTIGGIYGTIVSIKDDTVTIAVGRQNVELVFARNAIATVEDVSITNESEELN